MIACIFFFFFLINSVYTVFFPVCHSSPYEHFQRIVKAFLINAIDDTFLSSLYGKYITLQIQ